MKYTVNNYNSRKIADKYFISTDNGSYVILSKDEFDKLKNENMDDKLEKKLYDGHILVDEKNMEQIVQKYRKKKSFLFSGASLHIIVVTLRCNTKCVYCHASSRNFDEQNYDMSIETASKTVDFIFQSPSNDITIEFQGGEPLLNWAVIKHLTEYAQKKNLKAKKNLRMILVSNLSEMNDDKLDFIINHDIKICTSLDGPKELHDFNRKYISGSSYETTIKQITKIKEEYAKRGMNEDINALTTLTKKSLDYPKEIVDEYVKLGIKEIHLRFLNNIGTASKNWEGISYSVKDYLRFWNDATNYIEELNNAGVDITERMVDIMTKKISEDFDPNYLELRNPCGAAIGQIAYNYDGDIYTCDEARMIGDELFLIGSVKNSKYGDVIGSEKVCNIVNLSINDQYSCILCAYKPYCGICPVCNYVEQGTVIGKIPETDRCKIYMDQFDTVVKKKFINVKT